MVLMHLLMRQCIHRTLLMGSRKYLCYCNFLPDFGLMDKGLAAMGCNLLLDRKKRVWLRVLGLVWVLLLP